MQPDLMDIPLSSRKLERAEQLITGFGGEREKWAEMSQKLETQYIQVNLITCFFTHKWLHQLW